MPEICTIRIINTMNIRYFIYIFLTITLFSCHLSAQQFNGGVLAGVGATEISGDNIWGPNKAGLYFGAFVNRYISNKSSFQMELNYVQKGSRENPDSTNSYSSYLLRLNYVELFLNYKWDFAPKLTLEGGPSFGVLIKSYEEADGQTYDFDPFNQFDLSLNIGLYYSLRDNLRLNTRYSNSIIPVREWTGGISYGSNKGQYNEVLSFTLQYQINKPTK